MTTIGARARTAASETAFQAELSAETNQSQPINPAINSPATQEAAAEIKDIRR
jgi:hypothetical protein